MGQHVSHLEPALPPTLDSNYEQYKANPVIPDPKVYALLQRHLRQGSFWIPFCEELSSILYGDRNVEGKVSGTLIYINDIKYKIYQKLLAFRPVPGSSEGTIHITLNNDYPYLLFMACLLDMPQHKNTTVFVFPPSGSMSPPEISAAIGFVRTCFSNFTLMRMAYYEPTPYRISDLADSIRARMKEYASNSREHQLQARIDKWDKYVVYTEDEDAEAGAGRARTVSFYGEYTDYSGSEPARRILASDSLPGSHVSSNQQAPVNVRGVVVESKTVQINWDAQTVNGIYIGDYDEFLETAMRLVDVNSVEKKIGSGSGSGNDNNARGGPGLQGAAGMLVAEINPYTDGFFEVDQGRYAPATLMHIGAYTTPTPGRYMILTVLRPIVEQTFRMNMGTVFPVDGSFVRQMGGRYDGEFIVARRYSSMPELEAPAFSATIQGMDMKTFKTFYK